MSVCTKLRPAVGIAWLYRGEAARKLGQLDSATDDFKRSLELNDNQWLRAQSYRGLSLIERKHGRLETALAYSAKAIQASPNDAQLRFQRVMHQFELSGKEDAVKEAHTFLERTSESTSAFTHQFRARVYAILGDFRGVNQAIATCLRLEANPGLRSAHQRIVSPDLIAVGEFDAALQMYLEGVGESVPQEIHRYESSSALILAQDAFGIFPQNENCRSFLGQVQYRHGQLEATVATLKPTDDESEPANMPQNAFYLATSHWRLGNKEQARKYYEQAAAWMDKNVPDQVRFETLRKEAEARLGVNQ
jgi:tetratricopeptide (TPR) repeat protein